MSKLLNESLASIINEGHYDNRLTLKSVDYIIFLLMLAISTAIGIYFGFIKKSANTTSEYLMGDKKMQTLPVGISMVASQLSAAAILSVPAEIYVFGLDYIFIVLSGVIIAPILIYIVVPVIYNNNFGNCYEYLSARFNNETRKIMTLFFVLTYLGLLPAYIFTPALAFAQVSGINIHLVNAILICICIFYTMFGGIKAVVWTDVFQGGIMILTVAIVAVMGLYQIGGFNKTFGLANAGNRLDVNFTMDLRPRSTFWNCFLFGIVFYVAHMGLTQSCVQRLVSLPTVKHANRAVIIFVVGIAVIYSFETLTGLIIFGRYFNCDPMQTGHITKMDQLLPFFVQDTVGHLHGMSGLFVASVFSAALSTMSANLNALSGIIYLDYIKPRIQHSERKATIIMKLFILFTGIYCIALGFVVERISSIYQILYSIVGVTYGTVFGVFLLGMLVPKAHGRAVICAVLGSVAIMLSIVAGSIGRNQYRGLVASIEGCAELNITTISNAALTSAANSGSITDRPFHIFDISYTWYIPLGALIFFVIAIPLSYILPAHKDYKLNRNLLAPIVQRFVKYELANLADVTELQ